MGFQKTMKPDLKLLDILLAKPEFFIRVWWDLDIRGESYASWKLKLPGPSNMETLVTT